MTTALALLIAFQSANVTLQADVVQKAGWMPGGWGSYAFSFDNPSEVPARIVKWKAAWYLGDERQGDAWGGDLGLDVLKGKPLRHVEVGKLPAEVAAKSVAALSSPS